MKSKLLTISLLLITLISCSVDESELYTLEEAGYFSFKGITQFPTITSKGETPECSDLESTKLLMTFTNLNEVNFVREGRVSFQNGVFSLEEDFSLPVNTYFITEAYITAEDGTRTFGTPSKETTQFDFTPFVDKPLPLEIEIVADQLTSIPLEVLCYSHTPLQQIGTSGITAEVVEMTTVWVKLNTCIDNIVIITDTKVRTNYNVFAGGTRGFPILKNEDSVVQAIVNGQVIAETLITDYDPGLLVTLDEVIDYSQICN